MNAGEELSSNDEAQGDEDSSKAKLSLTEDNVKDLVSSLLLSIVEYLTKICVLCEADNVADRASVKALAKLIYKFEKSLKKLQRVIEHSYAMSYDLGSVVKGLIRAVDEYSNPYDWLYANVVAKHLKAGTKLDGSLALIDRLQRRLVDALQAPHSDPPAAAQAEPAAQPAQ